MTAHDKYDLSPAAAFRLIAVTLLVLVALLVGLVLAFGAPGLGIFGLVATAIVFAVMLTFTAGN
jgi:hypothetical protein